MDHRANYRVGLSPLYVSLYDALCAELPDDWQPYCGLRSFVGQDALYMQGRTLPGRIVTMARGGLSPHQYGCASDWCLWDAQGRPQWPSVKDEKWQEYANAIEKVGLAWGGDFSHPDCPHNELPISVTWSAVFAAYNAGRMEGAQAFIQSVMG